MGVDGERRVEQQDALTGPTLEIAVGRHRFAEVALDLFENIYQRRRHGHTRRHRETQAVGLTGAVVGILTEDDDLDFVKGAGVEGGKYPGSRRIDGRRLIALTHEVGQRFEIWHVPLVGESVAPCRVYSDVHFEAFDFLFANLRKKA